MADRGKRGTVVHRRRRAAALSILLVLALVIAIVVWRPWEQIAELVDAVSPSEAPATEAPETEDPESSQPYTPVGGVPDSDEGGLCDADQVVITALTNATTYEGDQEVQMSFRIENVSDAPCSLNVGTTEQEYVVRTGDQVVYRSTDCPIDAVDQVVELQPHVPQETIPIEWDRTFSSPQSCTTPRDPVVAGGASYHLSVTVAGIAAQDTVQFILL